MKIPTIVGTIERRILINYQADKKAIERFLPKPFRPKLVKDKAIVGICLIRLKNIRPKGLPFNFGVSSENGAHRIAVEWTENGSIRDGVYIPRRDTSSRLNHMAGGLVFPGVHNYADFLIHEANGAYNIKFRSKDGTFLKITAEESEKWSNESVFDDVDSASNFFKRGWLGFSPGKKPDTFDGLELRTNGWAVSLLNVDRVESSFFQNESIFPKGSIQFDNALLMKNINHEWSSCGLHDN